MSQRLKNSVATNMTSEPETLVGEREGGYSTRNKRRKLNEVETFPKQTNVFELPTAFQIPRTTTMETIHNRNPPPMYSGNLDKALKSILSESPKMRRAREVSGEASGTVEYTPSITAAEDADSSNTAVVVASQGNGDGTPSVS